MLALLSADLMCLMLLLSLYGLYVVPNAHGDGGWENDSDGAGDWVFFLRRCSSGAGDVVLLEAVAATDVVSVLVTLMAGNMMVEVLISATAH